jgi:hypothetical protein
VSFVDEFACQLRVDALLIVGEFRCHSGVRQGQW